MNLNLPTVSILVSVGISVTDPGPTFKFSTKHSPSSRGTPTSHLDPQTTTLDTDSRSHAESSSSTTTVFPPTSSPPDATSSTSSLQSTSSFGVPFSSDTGSYFTSAIVTTISGTVTTIYSTFPTRLSDSDVSLNPHRTIMIASIAVGCVLFFILLLCAVLLYRRYRKRKRGTPHYQKRRIARAQLLDGEGFDDVSEFVPMAGVGSAPFTHRNIYRFSDISSINNYPRSILTPDFGGAAPVNPSMYSLASSTSQTPGLLHARTSQTGSIFHEDVWPPPGETSTLVDPVVQANSEVDLSRIVDDIMGPEPNLPPNSPPSTTEPRNFTNLGTNDSGRNTAQPLLFSFSSANLHDAGSIPRPTSAASSLPFSADVPNSSHPRLHDSQPRNSSPLALVPPVSPTTEISGDERESPRSWLKRSPVKRTSRLSGIE